MQNVPGGRVKGWRIAVNGAAFSGGQEDLPHKVTLEQGPERNEEANYADTGGSFRGPQDHEALSWMSL